MSTTNSVHTEAMPRQWHGLTHIYGTCLCSQVLEWSQLKLLLIQGKETQSPPKHSMTDVFLMSLISMHMILSCLWELYFQSMALRDRTEFLCAPCCPQHRQQGELV